MVALVVVQPKALSSDRDSPALVEQIIVVCQVLSTCVIVLNQLGKLWKPLFLQARRELQEAWRRFLEQNDEEEEEEQEDDEDDVARHLLS